jgi:DNA (cytosine-5)-methyltransferase 1
MIEQQTIIQHETANGVYGVLGAVHLRPKLLDLYCGAGGAGWGYYLSGFDVTGVDVYKQPKHRKEMKFIQANALEILDDIEYCRTFDVIHASPVCKKYSVTASLHNNEYPDDIPIVREKLKKIGKPYVIENVPGAPLINYVILCGTMFGLKVIRHRLFECEPAIYFPPMACSCDGKTNSHRAYSSFEKGARYITVAGNNYKADDGREAMGIDWMTREYLSQAIPPAYTKWIGEQMMTKLSLHCR